MDGCSVKYFFKTIYGIKNNENPFTKRLSLFQKNPLYK